ncbi:MAG: peptidoglycan bridge formation glycyltransferase FemA/FemB family protein [Flavobacteriales bacterium]
MYIDNIHIDQLDSLNTTDVFNSKDWIANLQHEGLQLLGVFNKNKEIIGCFYFSKYKRGKVLSQISAPPFSPHCGLFVQDNTVNPAQKITFRKKVLALVSDYFNERKFDILSVPFPAEYTDMQEFIWSKFRVEPRYTYQLDLNDSEESLLANMSSERRKNIRKAEKDGIIATLVTNLDEAKILIAGTYKKQSISGKEAALDKIFNSFATAENSICFVSYDKEKTPVATVFCVMDKETCYYILGGYHATKKHEGAGALAMWSAIKLAKDNGVKTFDFEGSMMPAIEKYFRGFGGKIVPFFSIKKENLLGNTFLKLRSK